MFEDSVKENKQINEELFQDVYNENCIIISSTNDPNILSKKKKLNKAYQSMLRLDNPEHKDFYSDVHELRTYKYLIDKGFSIVATNDNKPGPDFYVSGLGYVECVICTRGDDGTEARATLERRLDGCINRYKAALPRLTTAIKEKRDKFAKYLVNGVIDASRPRIIAVNTSIFSNLVHSDLMVELAEQILYGIGCQTIHFNAITKQFESINGTETHCFDDKGEKTLEKELNLSYFDFDEYRDISAVILTNNAIGEKLTDKYFSVFLNPNASISIPANALENLNSFGLTKKTETGTTYQWNKVN